MQIIHLAVNDAVLFWLSGFLFFLPGCFYYFF